MDNEIELTNEELEENEQFLHDMYFAYPQEDEDSERRYK